MPNTHKNIKEAPNHLELPRALFLIRAHMLHEKLFLQLEFPEDIIEIFHIHREKKTVLSRSIRSTEPSYPTEDLPAFPVLPFLPLGSPTKANPLAFGMW